MSENERKPFYKRNWFWITILSIIVVVSATTYVANYAFYQDKADQTTLRQRKSQSLKKKAEKSPSLITKYNSIKTGREGYSKRTIYKLLGNPKESQLIDPEGQIENVTWNGTDNNNEVMIQITFEKNKAQAKSIQGLDIDRENSLTLVDYNKIADGDGYNRVIDVLGEPDDYSDMNGIRTLTYVSDLSELDPTQNASIQIKLSNNQVISKSQINVK